MADGSRNLWTGLLKYSKNRGVFCHVTNDEMDFSEVISGDMPSCSFSGNLNVLFKRNKIHLVLRYKIHKHFGSLDQGLLHQGLLHGKHLFPYLKLTLDTL